MKFPGQVEILLAPDEGGSGGVSSPAGPTSSDASASGEGSAGGVESSPSTSSPDAPSANDDFADFNPFTDMDEVEVPEPAAKPSSDPAAPAKGAAQAKDSVTPPPGGDPAVPKAEAAPPAAPVAQVQESAASSQLSEIGNIVQGLDKEAPALRNWLAENVYALTKEEKDGLETEAWTVIPKLLSRVHLEISKTILNQIENFVPKMAQQAIGKFKESTDKRTEALGAFYKANPSLTAGDHDAVVDQYARMFRANNPRASREEAFKFVGAAVAAHFGVVPSAPGAATPKGNGSKPPPFQPARPGARQIAQTAVAGDEWSGLGQTFDEE